MDRSRRKLISRSRFFSSYFLAFLSLFFPRPCSRNRRTSAENTRVWRQIRRNYDRAGHYLSHEQHTMQNSRAKGYNTPLQLHTYTYIYLLYTIYIHKDSLNNCNIYTYIYITSMYIYAIVTFARGAPRRRVAIPHNASLPPNAFIARINGARRFLIIPLIYGTRAAPFTVSFLFPFFRFIQYTRTFLHTERRIMKTCRTVRERIRSREEEISRLFHVASLHHSWLLLEKEHRFVIEKNQIFSLLKAKNFCKIALIVKIIYKL